VLANLLGRNIVMMSFLWRYSVGRSVGLVPLSLALRRSGGTAVVPSGAHQRRGGAARAGSRPERRNPLHLNIIKYPLQQGQNLRTPCSSRCCARLVLAPALSACRPLSPLSRPSLPTRPSPPVACQNPSTLSCSSPRVSKKSAPEMTFILLCGANAPRPPKEARRFRPLQKRTFAFSIFVRGFRGRNGGMSRSRGRTLCPSKSGLMNKHIVKHSTRAGVVKSKGPAVVVGQLKTNIS
jgi:hypothetical protein